MKSKPRTNDINKRRGLEASVLINAGAFIRSPSVY